MTKYDLGCGDQKVGDGAAPTSLFPCRFAENCISAGQRRRLDICLALGRHVRLLEESLGTALLLRTTRNVMLSAGRHGAALMRRAPDRQGG